MKANTKMLTVMLTTAEVWGRLKAAWSHVNCFILILLLYHYFLVFCHIECSKFSWAGLKFDINYVISISVSPNLHFPSSYYYFSQRFCHKKNLLLWCFSVSPFPFNFLWQFLAAIRILPTHIPAIQQSLIGSSPLLPEIPHRGWRKPCFPQLR